MKWVDVKAPKPRAATPYIVLALGLAITTGTVAGVHGCIRARDNARFASALRATEDRIEARLATYIAMMRAVRAFYVVSNGVTVDEFRRYTAELDIVRSYPGIQGIGFTERFSWKDRESVEARVRAWGVSDFRVWPGHERPEGHSIVMLEPQDARNRAAIGFDMYSEPVRRAAMESARDHARPAASGLVTLVQEIDEHKQAGFLIYLPVYAGGGTPTTVDERRASLVGYVYSPFRASDLFYGIFGTETRPRVGFAVYDERVADHTLLHRSGPESGSSRFTATTDLDVAGRSWKVRFWSLPVFEEASSRGLLALMGGAGAIASVLLFLLWRSRTRVARELGLRSLILDSMREGVSVSDQSGTILYTNPAEDRMFGYDRGELIGKPVTVQNTYPPEENERIVGEVISELRENGAWAGEFSNVKKDGTPFTTSARITALDLGEKPVWVCVQEDVTERKRIEVERATLLEREHEARLAAESASRTKDEFLAVLGHELRNPLAPIVTALELIDQRHGREGLRELDVVERQVRHLRRMVDDLLDVSAIARGKVSLEKRPLELARIVRQAVELSAPLLENRKHELVVEVPESDLVVHADESRLVQVFSNLLNNAAKYTDPSGRIVIRAERIDGSVVTRVIDNGIGIDATDLGRIFELFAQGERRIERARGGLGVGLSLARSLVELHGGSIEARSEGRGSGTEIIVHLPIAGRDAPAEPATPPVGPVKTTSPRRVLIVDDNPDAADLLGDVLRDSGHEVEVVYDPLQALAVAERWKPDFAILDIGLPVMDGYELAARLTTQSRVRLVALTGYGRDLDRKRSVEAGFEHYLVKPVSIAAVLEILEA